MSKRAVAQAVRWVRSQVRGVPAHILIWTLIACSATLCLFQGLLNGKKETPLTHEAAATVNDHTGNSDDHKEEDEEEHSEDEEEEKDHVGDEEEEKDRVGDEEEEKDRVGDDEEGEEEEEEGGGGGGW